MAPLSNDAAAAAAVIVGLDGGGRLGCRVGLGERGEEVEEGIHCDVF